MKLVGKDRDNDDIAARVAKIVKADTVVFLTQGEGVKDRDNNIVSVLAEENERVIFVGISSKGTGGMESKINFAKDAAGLSENVFIVEGRTPEVLLRIARNEHIGTRIVAGDRIH